MTISIFITLLCSEHLFCVLLHDISVILWAFSDQLLIPRNFWEFVTGHAGCSIYREQNLPNAHLGIVRYHVFILM